MRTFLVAVLMAAVCAEAGAKAGAKMEELRKNFRAAELVLVVKPLRVEKSPGIWSGTLATFQAVQYRVVRVLKGAPPDETVTVLHPLVARSRTADEHEARLRESLFDGARTLVVFARLDNGKLVSFDENWGVVPASDETLAALEELRKGE
jgi:hypothetical protein